jgi:hypothetical protein
MAINTPAFNLVRQTLRALNDPGAEMPTETFADAERAFIAIEADVEQLMKDVEGYQAVERDLRQAMEADVMPGAQFQRRQ